MTLLEEIKAHYAEYNYPPNDYDDFEQVHREALDELRWGTCVKSVYQRGDEFVAVEDVEPATEEQNWGDYGPPTIYAVEPYEVTVTKYRAIKD